MSDLELLAGVSDGDVSALRQLHEQHAPWLAARLYRRCSDQALVDEVVQDTFVVVWRTAGKFRGEGDVGAWIWGIAVRKLMDRLRRKPLPGLHRPEQVQSAEDAVLVGIGYGDLGEALSSLSPELLAVVQATILDGLTTREAARLLGIPAGTVKTRLMRAKQLMRERLA
jgi:RNA polymerase sigma-70 factor (ECF subfamily)